MRLCDPSSFVERLYGFVMKTDISMAFGRSEYTGTPTLWIIHKISMKESREDEKIKLLEPRT